MAVAPVAGSRLVDPLAAGSEPPGRIDDRPVHERRADHRTEEKSIHRRIPLRRRPPPPTLPRMGGGRPGFDKVSIPRRLRATTAALLDLLFPWSCAACERACGEALCEACRRRIPWLPSTVCECCGIPREPGACGPCRLEPPAFARARAVAAYAPREGQPDPLGIALRSLKYGGRRALAHPLGALLAARQPFPPGEHDVIVPVPLHPARLRERGFNQALLLARPVASRLRLPLALDALRRVRPTPPQASLDERTRRRNVRDAFDVKRPREIRDRRVLLVDDVVTSGATADACARALRAAGATRVDVLSLARALQPDAR